MLKHKAHHMSPNQCPDNNKLPWVPFNNGIYLFTWASPFTDDISFKVKIVIMDNELP